MSKVKGELYEETYTCNYFNFSAGSVNAGGLRKGKEKIY